MFLCVLCACASKTSSSQTDSATLRHKIELDEVKERHRVALVGEVVDFEWAWRIIVVMHLVSIIKADHFGT